MIKILFKGIGSNRSYWFVRFWVHWLGQRNVGSTLGMQRRVAELPTWPFWKCSQQFRQATSSSGGLPRHRRWSARGSTLGQAILVGLWTPAPAVYAHQPVPRAPRGGTARTACASNLTPARCKAVPPSNLELWVTPPAGSTLGQAILVGLWTPAPAVYAHQPVPRAPRGGTARPACASNLTPARCKARGRLARGVSPRPHRQGSRRSARHTGCGRCSHNYSFCCALHVKRAARPTACVARAREVVAACRRNADLDVVLLQ